MEKPNIKISELKGDARKVMYGIIRILCKHYDLYKIMNEQANYGIEETEILVEKMIEEGTVKVIWDKATDELHFQITGTGLEKLEKMNGK